jgi:hypothetical protein
MTQKGRAMSPRRARQLLTRCQVSAALVAVFQGTPAALFLISHAFTETASYREHVRRHSSTSVRAYRSLLSELERLTRPRAQTISGRRQPAAIWQRLCFSWAFAPREDYATRFVNTTKRRLVSTNPAAKKEGERGLKVLVRLLFEADWPRRGRGADTSKRVSFDVLKTDREALLPVVQAVYRRFPARDHADAQRRAAIEQVIAEVLPSRVGTLKRKHQIERLMQRKKVGPAEVTNQVVAWKHGVRAAAVQATTARPPEPPEVWHG